jgi:hypothetical protein
VRVGGLSPFAEHKGPVQRGGGPFLLVRRPVGHGVRVRPLVGADLPVMVVERRKVGMRLTVIVEQQSKVLRQPRKMAPADASKRAQAEAQTLDPNYAYTLRGTLS